MACKPGCHRYAYRLDKANRLATEVVLISFARCPNQSKKKARSRTLAVNRASEGT